MLIENIKRFLGFGGKYPGDAGYWTAPDWYSSRPTEAGAAVTETSALSLSAVYRCDRVLCDTIASLPIDVYKRTSKGSEIDTNHPAQYLLKSEPNEYQTSFTLREASQHAVNFHGNSYWKINFDKSARPESLTMLDGHKISAEIKEGKLTYQYDKNKKFRPDQIVHVANLSLDGFTGRGYLQAAREVIGQGVAMQKYSSQFFRNDATARYVLTTDQLLNTKQIQEYQEMWKKAAGGENKHSTPVLAGGFKPLAFSMNHEDAQFLETRKFSVVDVCRFFGVPPHLAFDLERATFSNIEHQQIEYVVHTVRPLVKRWEAELNRKLLTEKEKRSGSHYIKFNLDALMRGDQKSRAEFYQKLFSIGSLTPNEIRAHENMNSIPNGDQTYVLNLQKENGGRTPD